ncbi:NADH-quinone oxidoreductase subunit NuoF [Clostridium gasigenes]|uniref:NADH-ubiquinone oxidoreductase-F iron-sulfur binding region domain-containing protein n=1 Tax=Clostridium gasigenes TaxID=94869 RepID=UPI001626DA68|nr:NADH-quinone oxidoreductase subunit NuoF [Clostridium gasigenes]MBU3087586.1 NADH-quinone oxidoreductase subunit NuoF [Clostridium gasigenes]MBU3131789.1 NADH-quinone oxidoreductase subunit NuoF [Clostridium gasigenes]MBU3135261.1 NADH-quinone oxidoreductase subunit NuoF [Clostridium gasigenes]
MERIYDYKSLLLLKSKYEDTILMRKNQPTNSPNIVENEKHIMVCGGTGCKASNSDKIIDALNSAIEEKNLKQRVKVVMTGCFGFCAQGPIVQILPDKTFYIKVTKEDAEEIINKHIIKGEIIDRLLYTNPETKKSSETRDEIPFYKRQKRIALRNCGVINPENIEETIGSGGYIALGKVLTEMTKEEVIQEITDSGLRGRGGGGFKTGIKWGATLKSQSDKKYVICNADEGDPGAFMDRSILEGDPHSVLEAMAICAYAIGSDIGYIYIRAEYPLAISRLEIAIRQANYMGLLGENILGTGFNFNIKIKYGAGAFVCGEATALIHSIEGLRGEPTMKPPRTSERGLWNKPTCVNNVETFANITAIINNGAKWYRSIGTKDSPGTKVFSLAGKINNVGLVEVPMGISLKEIIYDIGGGVIDNKKLKGVQTGGPSGGCIPTSLLDIPIEYDTLTEIGSMMGSGGMIVIDEDNCMVDIAKFYLDFIVDESCGKCTPCRIGTKKILELLNKITEGEGTNDDLNNIKELCEVIKETALCGLGDSAPNPVLSTMKFFMDEYKSHIEDKHCRAGVCKQLLSYEITDKCIGCTKCARNCPQKCITGRIKEKHILDSSNCIKCGTCLDKCPVKAIIIK